MKRAARTAIVLVAWRVAWRVALRVASRVASSVASSVAWIGASSLAVALLLASCGGALAGPHPTRPGDGVPGPNDAISARVAHEAETGTAAETLPFLHDDFASALAEAKRTKRMIFVDAWAPWCHSCQSMRAYVLTDPSLAPLAKDFVWLAVDTEKDQNAAFVTRYPNRVWPTLWVVDPARDDVVMRWEGTATAPELVSLLGAVRDMSAQGQPAADKLFLHGSHAAARGELGEAVSAYSSALMHHDFAGRPRVVEALVGLHASRKDFTACTDLAVAEAPALPPGTSRATVLATGLSCAREAKRDADLQKLAEAAEKAALDQDPRTVADDRSALFEELVETKKERGDAKGAKTMARTWATFLESVAAKAPTRQARAVFDAHRLSAYLAAGEPERAIPMLTQSEREFPADYNPPARLARAYLTMKRLDDAKAAIGRASSRVYGPRSLRVFALAADIAKESRDVAGERAALEQALARTSNAVLADNQKKLRAELEKRLRDLGR